MFGLGFWEIAIVFMVVLILFRPEDMPKILRSMGKVFAQIKSFYRGTMSSFTEISDDIRRPVNDIKRATKLDTWGNDATGQDDDSKDRQTKEG